MIDDSGCWLWTGYVRPDGYVTMNAFGRRTTLQQASFEAFIGPIPEGMEIDHLCAIKHCANPLHLQPVLHAVNVRRRSWTGKCAAGHRLPPDAPTHQEVPVCLLCLQSEQGRVLIH